MKIKNLITKLQEYDPEANIYFTLDPESKEGYYIGEWIELVPTLIMGILKQRKKEL